ncbi:MAG TPA: hypothetical protein VGO93_31205 [Candidatus Xenobia bacterium]
MKFSKMIAAALMFGSLALGSLPAMADTCIPSHPRVNEVNSRFENQYARIQNGSLSPWEQRRLHGEYDHLKVEEQSMRRADRGHLTRADQIALNRQLNARSNQIYRLKHH